MYFICEFSERKIVIRLSSQQIVFITFSLLYCCLEQRCCIHRYFEQVSCFFIVLNNTNAVVIINIGVMSLPNTLNLVYVLKLKVILTYKNEKWRNNYFIYQVSPPKVFGAGNFGCDGYYSTYVYCSTHFQQLTLFVQTIS